MTRKIGFIGYRNHAKKLLDIVENKENFEISKIYHPTKNIDDSRITNNLEDLVRVKFQRMNLLKQFV